MFGSSLKKYYLHSKWCDGNKCEFSTKKCESRCVGTNQYMPEAMNNT